MATLAQRALAAARAWRSGDDGGPEYLQRFEIPVEALAEQPEQAVAGRLLKWQSTVPTYPRGNYRQVATAGYLKSIPFRRCVDMLTSNFCQGRLEVADQVSGEANPASDLPEIFLRGGRVTPAPGITGRLLWTRFIQDAYVFGNSLWEKVWSVDGRRVLELWRLDPQYVAVEPDAAGGWVKRYLYFAAGKWWPIPVENIVHWYFPDPLQNFFGVPPIVTGLRDMTIDSAVIDHLKLTLQNYGVPAAVLEHEGKITETEATEARAKFKSRLKGGGDVVVTGKGTTVRVIGMDFSKMGIGDLTATTEARIAQIHGVPLILLGRSGTKGDPTRANYGEAKEHFWFDTILPLMDLVADILTTFLLPNFSSGGEVARFNTDRVPVLQQARLKRAVDANELFKSALVSRHRAQDLSGIDRHGADVFYRPASVEGVVPGDATEEVIEEEEVA